MTSKDGAPGLTVQAMDGPLGALVEGIDLRQVNQAQKSAIDRVYAMLPGGSIAVSKLNDHFRDHNPFALAAKESVSVAVTNLLPLSERTWQLEWQEVTRDQRGQVLSNVRMRASILVGITPPTQESLILVNPLGVYITDLNWSQQL